MLIPVQAIEQRALMEANVLGHRSIQAIPKAEQNQTIDRVAEALGACRDEVELTLMVHWLETAGRSGADITGSQFANATDTQARGNHTSSPMAMRLGNRRPVRKGPTIIKNPKMVCDALVADHPSAILDIPNMLGATHMRKGMALDAHIDGDVGDCRAIDFSKIPDDDPVWDMPIFRGMSCQDPAVHALRLTGKLIPQGLGGDYEGFKRYDHKMNLDAYEWTLDPYVALKAAGGNGYLVQVTLRDLKDQGEPMFARMVGDSEGGIFISDVVEPKVRPVSHGEGCYELGSIEPKVRHPKAEKFANYLAKAVPMEGGWDEFLDGDFKAVKPLQKAHLHETKRQVTYWMGKVRTKLPNSKLPDRIQAQMGKLDSMELSRALDVSREMVASLKTAWACS